MGKILRLLRRAKYIIQTGGPAILLKAGLWLIYERNTYYLYEATAADWQSLDEADFKPKIRSFTHKIIYTNQEADELEAQGFQFRSSIFNTDAKKNLDQGAIAFCVFVGRQLASATWVATNERAADSLNEPPLNVDFSQNEAIGGRTWTNPQHRRLGLTSYNVFRVQRFLLDRGITRWIGAMDSGNIPSQALFTKLGMRKHAELRSLRILWWTFWK